MWLVFEIGLYDPGTVLIGEVGLGGQVRSVSQMELRLKEAAKLGFKRGDRSQRAKIPGAKY